MELEVKAGSQNNVSVLRCRGRLVYGPEAAEFVRAVRQALQTSKEVVLQMADVAQIDSGGVGALGTVFTTAHNRGAEIKLAALDSRVADVLRITNVELLFDIRDSESEAVAAFLRKEKPGKTWLEVAADSTDHRA